MSEFPKINRMGERSILIEFDPEIKETLLEKLLNIRNAIEENSLKSKVEVINTYNSLLINYKSGIKDFYSEVTRLKRLMGEANIHNKINPSLFHIPVCYDDVFALDLDHISSEKGLSKKQLLELHTAPVYTVYFIGFLPGFLYLGGLDEKLNISRKDQPRLAVEKGAVGIGENQTGIYPKSSPGGWQIIGNSPVPLFDKNSIPPCQISPGDKIRFYSIDLEQHRKISEEVKHGRFSFRKEKYES